jgi:hypothetical protein
MGTWLKLLSNVLPVLDKESNLQFEAVPNTSHISVLYSLNLRSSTCCRPRCWNIEPSFPTQSLTFI